MGGSRGRYTFPWAEAIGSVECGARYVPDAMPDVSRLDIALTPWLLVEGGLDVGGNRGTSALVGSVEKCGHSI
jgi:hypothetical protein